MFWKMKSLVPQSFLKVCLKKVQVFRFPPKIRLKAKKERDSSYLLPVNVFQAFRVQIGQF